MIDDRTPAPLANDAGQRPALASRGAPAITVGSLSKVVWAGLRIGWLHGSEAVVREVEAARIAADLSPPITNQVLAAGLVPHLDELRDATRAELAVRAAAAQDALAQDLPEWQVGPSVLDAWRWVALPAHTEAARVAEAAEPLGVRVTPGSVFAADAGARSRLRLSTVLPPDELRRGIARLAEAWALASAAPAAPRSRLLVL